MDKQSGYLALEDITVNGVNYAKGDFRLKPGSPAKGKGASL